ncbi:UNVERIFIED_ORG: hypothetical protein J3D58_000452 [Paenarthrobacter nicotinovorans]
MVELTTSTRAHLDRLPDKCLDVRSLGWQMLNKSVDDVEFLHPGRYRWTLDDLAAKYLTETQYGQTRRQVIWDHFKLATETLRQTVPVAAVWVGGSFLSTKAEPSDVDAVYIVRGRAYDALDDESKQFVSVFNGGEQLKANGLLVDSYVIHWTPRASNGPETESDLQQLTARGYWDDWLQRHKIDRTAPATDQDAFPVRGYVEVILDGFDA